MLRHLAALAVICPGALHATSCEEAWLMRNLIFDRAGYCFGSPLGQAVFDNSDCTTTTPSLTETERAQVAELKAFEQGCLVDTSRRSLEVMFLDQWRAIEDIPPPQIGESACLGWKGPSILVHSGHHKESPVSGMIVEGDDIVFQSLSPNGWEFVLYDRGIGWIPSGSVDPEMCAQLAG